MPTMNIYLTEEEEQKLKAYKQKHNITNHRDAIGQILQDASKESPSIHWWDEFGEVAVIR